ncbi:MAG: hypothetical protein V1906_00825 [Candidatus Woesearchaeota archaeon]
MRIFNWPGHGVWAAVNDANILNDIKHRFANVQVWFSDLDDSDAKSPAKIIAASAIGASRFSLAYIGWCMKALYSSAAAGKPSESYLWADYVERFLRGDGALREIKDKFTDDFVSSTLYGGVKEFYSLLSARKYYVTRNIAEVVRPYASLLGFDGYFSEAKDKGRAVDDFVIGNPQVTRYGCSGDSAEDESMLDVLHFYKGRGRISDVVSLYIAGSQNAVSPDFDLATSRDRTGLVALLNGKE